MHKIINDLLIGDMVAEGKCVARHEGMVIFVENAVPGDVADVRISKKQKNFLVGVAVTTKIPSPQRIEPFCQHFGTCGGCKWQHLSYDMQLQFKTQQVVDAFERIGKFDNLNIEPIAGAEPTVFYRNKLEFTFSNRRWLEKSDMDNQEVDTRAFGFHIPGRFDKILQIDHCYLQADPSNEIRMALGEFARSRPWSYYDTMSKTGFWRNLVIRTTRAGELMLILIVGEPKEEALHEAISFLNNRFPGITSLHYIVNEKRNDSFSDLPVHHVSGQAYITEYLNGLQFRIGPTSFFQTNAWQAGKLYEKTLEFAELKGNELVYDLYTGTGTIACYVAKHAKKVVGIEYIAAAIEDAHVNASINNLQGLRFYAGDMKDVFTSQLIEQEGRPDVVITDPPRAGMHESVIARILEAAPEKIVYVSCNPATQARDCKMLATDYELVKLQPVDMFPHTHHVENIALLKRKSP